MSRTQVRNTRRIIGIITAALILSFTAISCHSKKDTSGDRTADASPDTASLTSHNTYSKYDASTTKAEDNSTETYTSDAGTLEQPEDERPSELIGDWPENLPQVTIQAHQLPVSDVLTSLFNQLRLGLVLDAPQQLLDEKISLWLVDKPGRPVLEAVLERASLKAELKNEIAFVTSREDDRQPDPSNNMYKDDEDKNRLIIEINAGNEEDWPVWHSRKHHKNDQIQFGKSLVVEKDEDVDDAVVIGGSLRVKGRVRGEAVAVGGSVIIESGGEVNGDAAAIGGQIKIKPGGTLRGQKTTVSGLLDFRL